jgi:UDP-GlcNAc:undecaprenyl-phosphate/decaprenyl-phosphate GlcNAc-1-phosphate transferase
MTPLIWLGVWAFVISLVLTPILRDVFRTYGVVDRPDSGRKAHPYPIPRIGGIAVFVSYFVSFVIAYYGAAGFDRAELSLVWALLPAAGVVFAVGLIDDFMGLKPWQKLAGQLAAAAMAYAAGVRILAVAGHSIEWWSIPLTLAWLLACTNAFNLVDGMDGMAAGVGLFATLTIFTAAMLQDNLALACATLPLAGCLLAFLCFNFNPATVFLGDCGSLLIGFLLGCYGVVWSNKAVTMLGMAAPLMALSIPLLDVLLSVVRRFLRRQPIFGADRGHIHHRLIDRGLTPGRAVLLIYSACGLAAALSLVQGFTRSLYLAFLVVLLFFIVAWIGIRYLSYSEFVLAGRFVRTGEFQRTLNTQLAIDKFVASLRSAKDLDECWRAIRLHYRSFGFSAIRLEAGPLSYREWEPHVGPPGFWTVRVPLTERDFVEVAREFDSPVMPLAMVPFIDAMRQALAERLPARGGDGASRAAGAS